MGLLRCILAGFERALRPLAFLRGFLPVVFCQHPAASFLLLRCEAADLGNLSDVPIRGADPFLTAGTKGFDLVFGDEEHFDMVWRVRRGNRVVCQRIPRAKLEGRLVIELHIRRGEAETAECCYQLDPIGNCLSALRLGQGYLTRTACLPSPC